MSPCSEPSLLEQPAYSANMTQENMSSRSERDVFTDQTGQVLVGIGALFLNVPPFNEHVDRKTADLLISLGKKLQVRK